DGRGRPELGGRGGLVPVRDGDGERPQVAGRHLVPGRVEDLVRLDGDRVGAVRGRRPAPARRGELVGGDPRGGVPGGVGEGEGRELVEPVRPCDADVFPVEAGRIQGHVVGVGHGERVRGGPVAAGPGDRRGGPELGGRGGLVGRRGGQVDGQRL